MSETRRDLFKTSVLGGLGLMSAAALAATAEAKGGHTPAIDLAAYILGVGPNSQWYLFSYVSTNPANTYYTVSVLKLGSKFTPVNPSVSKINIDILSWSQAAKADLSDAGALNGVMVGGVAVTTNARGQTNTHTTGVLHAHLGSACSWNEIGN